jgi:hypothetical protein
LVQSPAPENNIITFTSAFKMEIKPLDINLRKYVQNLSEENYKTIMTKKKEQKVHEGLFCIHGWEESRCQSLSI